VGRLRGQVRGQPHRDLRREERLLRGVDLRRVVEAVCRHYGVDRALLAARGHTEATRAELAPILGVTRPESVPDLTRRFAGWLGSRPRARQDLMALEATPGVGGKNQKLGLTPGLPGAPDPGAPAGLPV
jgi:hypothetical protein